MKLKLPQIFIAFHLIFLVAVAPVLLVTTKGDIVIWLNEYHTAFFDLLMPYITFLGDGLMLIVILIAALFFSFRRALQIIPISILILLFSQGLKRTIFSGWPRPTRYFPDIDWNFVEGVEVAVVNTFPSGHTITGFAIFFFLAFWTNNKMLQGLCWIAALLVGISRIYLLQHFLIDVYFGSILGMLAAILGQLLTDKFLGAERVQKLEHKSLRKL